MLTTSAEAKTKARAERGETLFRLFMKYRRSHLVCFRNKGAGVHTLKKTRGDHEQRMVRPAGIQLDTAGDYVDSGAAERFAGGQSSSKLQMTKTCQFD